MIGGVKTGEIISSFTRGCGTCEPPAACLTVFEAGADIRLVPFTPGACFAVALFMIGPFLAVEEAPITRFAGTDDVGLLVDTAGFF